jgi:plasmid stabilization system protein ParE
MLVRYRLLRLADAELTHAIAHYEREREGLGFEFFECYEAAALHALRFPESGSPVELKRLAQLGLQMRRVVLERFPYELVTMVVDEDLVIAAVAHQHRRPGYWIGRLAKTTR